MSFALDSFIDILAEPKANDAPTGKFQPKAKLRPRKEKSKSVRVNEDPVTLASSDPAQSVQPVSTVDSRGNTEALSKGEEDSFAKIRIFHENMSSDSVDSSRRPFETRENVASIDVLQFELGTWQSGYGKPTGENADIFSGLEYLDDFLSQSTAPATEIPTLHTSGSKAADIQELCDNDGNPVSNSGGDFHLGNRMMEPEEPEAFPSLENNKTSGQCGLQIEKERPVVPHDSEFVNEGSLPSFSDDGVFDFSPVRFGNSELTLNAGRINSSEVSPSDAAIIEQSQDVLDVTETVAGESRRKNFIVPDFSLKPQDQTLSKPSEDNEGGNLSRQLRNRKVQYKLVDESGDMSSDSPSMAADENGDAEYKEEDTLRNKKTLRKSNSTKSVSNEEKSNPKRKAREAPDKSTRESKKKFSHSTRRNRRRVDKSLLETPEDEIDHRTLTIKELIMLGEHNERRLNKNIAKSNMASANQSYVCNDASYDENENFGLEGSEQASPKSQTCPAQTCPPVNYHTYMDKIPRTRWSKEDTELFYQGIRQFGDNFSMIQQLLPDKTRHQIKLKYKKEERQHRLRLLDALTNRTKDHTLYELVIERLQQAAQAEDNFDRENSTDMAVEAEVQNFDRENSTGLTVEAEEGPPAKNEEVGKLEQNKEEEAVKDGEANNGEIYSPAKCDDSDEDELLRWSQYKSEL